MNKKSKKEQTLCGRVNGLPHCLRAYIRSFIETDVVSCETSVLRLRIFVLPRLELVVRTWGWLRLLRQGVSVHTHCNIGTSMRELMEASVGASRWSRLQNRKVVQLRRHLL